MRKDNSKQFAFRQGDKHSNQQACVCEYGCCENGSQRSIKAKCERIIRSSLLLDKATNIRIS
ncbi:MAG: hypothetical protein AB7V32_10330, partial [Candidatus Berkiella sp.]